MSTFDTETDAVGWSNGHRDHSDGVVPDSRHGSYPPRRRRSGLRRSNRVVSREERVVRRRIRNGPPRRDSAAPFGDRTDRLYRQRLPDARHGRTRVTRRRSRVRQRHPVYSLHRSGKRKDCRRCDLRWRHRLPPKRWDGRVFGSLESDRKQRRKLPSTARTRADSRPVSDTGREGIGHRQCAHAGRYVQIYRSVDRTNTRVRPGHTRR